MLLSVSLACVAMELFFVHSFLWADHFLYEPCNQLGLFLHSAGVPLMVSVSISVVTQSLGAIVGGTVGCVTFQYGKRWVPSPCLELATLLSIGCLWM